MLLIDFNSDGQCVNYSLLLWNHTVVHLPVVKYKRAHVYRSLRMIYCQGSDSKQWNTLIYSTIIFSVSSDDSFIFCPNITNKQTMTNRAPWITTVFNLALDSNYSFSFLTLLLAYSLLNGGASAALKNHGHLV